MALIKISGDGTKGKIPDPVFTPHSGWQLFNTPMTTSANIIPVQKIAGYALSTIQVAAIGGVLAKKLLGEKGPDGRALIVDIEELLPLPLKEVATFLNAAGSVTIFQNELQVSPLIFMTSSVRQGYVSVLAISGDITRIFEWIEDAQGSTSGSWEIRDYGKFNFEAWRFARNKRRNKMRPLAKPVDGTKPDSENPDTPLEQARAKEMLVSEKEIRPAEWGEQVGPTVFPEDWLDVVLYENGKGILFRPQKTLWRMEVIAEFIAANTGRDALAWFMIGLVGSENDLDAQIKEGKKFLGTMDGVKPVSASDQTLTQRLMDELLLWMPIYKEATYDFRIEEQSNISGKARGLGMLSFLGAVTETQRHMVNIYHRMGVDLKVGKLRVTDAKDDLLQWQMLKEQAELNIYTPEEFKKLARDSGFGDESAVGGPQAGTEKKIKKLGESDA